MVRILFLISIMLSISKISGQQLSQIISLAEANTNIESDTVDLIIFLKENTLLKL